jgi:hypothetical protein
MSNKPSSSRTIARCSVVTVFLLSLLTGTPATWAVGATNDADCNVKIHGKGYIINEGTNQPFRFNFKFYEKKDGELRGEFRGYDCETKIRLASSRTIAITEVAEDTWAIDFEVTVGTNGQDTARLTVSDGGKRGRDAVQLELSGGYAISGEVGRGTPCKDGDIKVKVKCQGGHSCEGHPECDEHHKCKGAPNCQGHPKCKAESCNGHKQCWTVVKHKKECKAKGNGKKGPKLKCKCPKYVVAH